MNGIGNKITTTTCETGTLEDVDDVVHHDVHSRQLRPHLERSTETDATEDTRLEQVEVGLGTLGLFKVDLLLNFSIFELDEVVGFVSSAVKVCKDFEGFFVPIKRMDDEMGGVRSERETLNYRSWSINQRGDYRPKK